jgi:lipoprotein-anchoring transpeptidase ErfK/SrfK
MPLRLPRSARPRSVFVPPVSRLRPIAGLRRAACACLAVATATLGLGAVAATVAPNAYAGAPTVAGAGIYNFGDAPALGSTYAQNLNQPVVSATRTPAGNGYWEVATDGGVFSYGAAAFHGSTGNLKLNQPIVGMASTPTGNGYWLVARDGGIFTFGDATFYGSTGNMTLNQPIVGMAATPSGNGYWMVASDGGIFTFGDATFYGSTGNMTLNQPIVGMAATLSGHGYWMVASDGGIFTFGDAAFHGSTGNIKLDKPITAMSATASGGGYWLTAADGGVFTFGNAIYKGRATIMPPSWKVFGIFGTASGQGYWQIAGPDPFVPTLNPGDSGEAVTQLQNQLTAQGYWLGPVNGQYGALTQQAVMAFQKVGGLPRTGVFDPTTRAAFATASRPTARTAGDSMEIDKARQVLFEVRNGAVVWIWNTSTGTEGPYTFAGVQYVAHTPEGNFRVGTVVDGVVNGRLGALYRPRFFTGDGVAVHGAAAIPAYPASHGCVRVTNAAADLIWVTNAMPVGSRVTVY